MGKRRHRILGALAVICAVAAALGTFARTLPGDLQALPYVPVLVSATPWFTILSVLALVMALVSARYLTALVAIACIGAQGWWQHPFFMAGSPLPEAAEAAVAAAKPDTADAYARVMTFNVYKGQADPAAIVEAVRDNRIEVLALQETTDAFVRALEEAGIGGYLPYSNVSSSDGVFGNGLWSATPLGDPRDTDVDSSASFMPGGTVGFSGGSLPVRFVSVHTTAPVPGYWGQWKRSLDELARMRADTGTRYVFMGDFNATDDHTPFRTFLGDRFHDAAKSAGHGFTFTWPTDKPPLPRVAGIDHIVLDQGMTAGQTLVKPIAGSDHAALIATIAVG
ncbi:endonuclease/exonuclease/phosphatase family protein [Bifidobacterium pullorum subsp. saeculare]|uniref:Endonuclease/exonuclease/phosphatase family protein n=1 Tax=Bifidobacterium pullorum subsp. saeculare TaxID=78257 RepID=A0A938WZW8_9BIFI|nr:endonuclease/exonuclease/phosphatase family protein [Bifidobacterium pullorum]MBM6699702.1 endonuclease/exonuclease/phosphatase family protein [Bifidobacterium pullorum subsp. saeculare]